MGSYSNPLTEYTPQMEIPDFEAEVDEAVFDEAEEMELAAELLAVRDEAEFDHFLGDLIQSAGRALGGIVSPKLGKALGGALRGLAKTALGPAGAVVGGIVGGPLGAQIGGRLATIAGPALGLELEGLSPEDREFEATRQFIRLAAEAVGHALLAPDQDPAEAVRRAIAEAMRDRAPGMLDPSSGGAASGRWVRHGDRIILFGI